MLSGSGRTAALASRNLSCGVRSSARSSNNTLRHHQQRNFSEISSARQWFAQPKPTPPAASPSPAPALRKAATTSAAHPRPPPPAATASPPKPSSAHDLTTGLLDPLPAASPAAAPGAAQVDWSRSFHGLSDAPFDADAVAVLLEPIVAADIEIKPDGVVYLPEIKYRRILNRAFGPGAWGLAPRGETIVSPRSVTREYGLVVQGRLVSIARGEQQYFDPEGIPTATEGCKSNALMRCCKDLGIASELWDPVFIRQFLAQHSKEVWAEHITSKKKKRLVLRKDVKGLPYPWKETKA